MAAMKELPEELQGLPLDHVAIAVHDLDEAAGPFRLLGLLEGKTEAVPQQGVRVRLLEAGPCTVELLEAVDEESPVARFIARRGPGLHHIALRVDSLTREMERLSALGARFTETVPRAGHAGSLVAFIHPSWSGGVLVELIERGEAAHG